MAHPRIPNVMSPWMAYSTPVATTLLCLLSLWSELQNGFYKMGLFAAVCAIICIWFGVATYRIRQRMFASIRHCEAMLREIDRETRYGRDSSSSDQV